MAIASCTPAARLAFLSCLSCLSDSELDKAFVVALAGNSGYVLPTDAGQMLEDSACWTCLTDKQLKQALISAYIEDTEPTLTMEQLRERLKCLQCANPKQIKALQAFLTCVVMQ